MNFALMALGFLVRTKHFKILLGIMIALIMLPACTVVVIAATPQAILDQIFGSSANASALNPAPSGIVILGGFSYPGDEYAPGNCTYWVYARRAQVGEPIPNTWGNADTWGSRAHNDGYLVDHTPTQYAIMQSSTDTIYGPGHVAFVESIEPNGNWDISEMNVGGLYIVDHKSMPPAAAQNYSFIHTKE